ncbi:MAG: hypothetical protein ABMA13_01490 [Chthoniobacteraceae bacterium]
MNLPVFSSKTSGQEPNLVGVQDEGIESPPTVLVCPMRRDLHKTSLRPHVTFADRRFVVGCDLVRPIHRRVLRLLGYLSDADSRAVIATQLGIFARED